MLVVIRRQRGLIDKPGWCLVRLGQTVQFYLGLGAWNGCVINIIAKQGSSLLLGDVLEVGQD